MTATRLPVFACVSKGSGGSMRGADAGPDWHVHHHMFPLFNAHAAQHRDDLLVLGELRDRALARQVPDLVDRTHHLAVNRVMEDLAHEAAVDLQEIDREMLQVAER